MTNASCSIPHSSAGVTVASTLISSSMAMSPRISPPAPCLRGRRMALFLGKLISDAPDSNPEPTGASSMVLCRRLGVNPHAVERAVDEYDREHEEPGGQDVRQLLLAAGYQANRHLDGQKA